MKILHVIDGFHLAGIENQAYEIISNYPEDNKSFLLNTNSSIKDTFEKFNSLKKELFNNKSVSVFIGPVGGFSDKEIEFFKSKKSEVINLGNTIFKSDTASIVGIALLKYLILDNLN